jgi:hypothetical protein
MSSSRHVATISRLLRDFGNTEVTTTLFAELFSVPSSEVETTVQDLSRQGFNIQLDEQVVRITN